MSNEKSANEHFRKATEAMAKEEWDIAIDRLLKASRLQPAKLVYRQALRGCEYRKFGDNKSGAEADGREKLKALRDRIVVAQLRFDWVACDHAAEEGLTLYPWDLELLKNLGKACREQGFVDIAIDSYKRAIVLDRNNPELRWILQELLDEFGE